MGINIRAAYPGQYIKAADLQKQHVNVVIERVEMEQVGKDTKPVVYFRGKQRGLVLNKTNGYTLADGYGDDTDQWIGQAIIMHEVMVDFQGSRVPSVRVLIPARKVATAAAATKSPLNGPQQATTPFPMPEYEVDDFADEIPF